MERKKIEAAMNLAYKEAGSNAYFGNGFNMGVEWAIQELEPKWIDVYDRLPDSDNAVLVYNGKFTDYCYLENGNFYNSHSIEVNHVRYWMPVPELPKED